MLTIGLALLLPLWLWGCGGDGSPTAGEAGQAADYAAGFADGNLAEAVRQALGKDQGPLDAADFASLTQLRAREYFIADLAGIERLTNLEILDLSHSRLASVAPLAGLVRLKELHLAGNRIEDIAPLAPLFNLRRLDLRANAVRRIATLARLTNLRWVDLSGNDLDAFARDSLLTLLAERNVEVVFRPVDAHPTREASGDPAAVAILYTTTRDGNREIYGIDATDGRLVNLSADPASDWAPAWAPDGARIAFVSDRGGAPEVHLADLGAAPVALTASGWPKSELRWSPDGRHIAYVESRDGQAFVQVVEAAGGALVWGSDPAGSALSPCWSPDGTRLAYSSDRDGARAVYAVDLRDGRAISLGAGTSPAWAPDGAHIAFASDRGGDDDIYLVASGGGPATNLTADPAADVLPAFSPDGARIAFVSDRRGQPEIYAMRRDGSAAEKLTRLGVVALAAPAWSADGSKILFETNSQGDFEIYIVDVASRALDNLSLHPGEDTDPRILPAFQAGAWTEYRFEPIDPFASPALEAAVRAALGDSGETLAKRDLLAVERLDVSSLGIADLRGIEQLRNLRWLVLVDNQVRDLTPLAGLARLEVLDAEGNHIRDLAPLSNLRQLADLNLNFNLVKELSPLLALERLRSLVLRGNPLSRAADAQLDQLRRRGVAVALDAPTADGAAAAAEPFVFPGPKIALSVWEPGPSGVSQQEIYLVSPDGRQLNISQDPAADDWNPAWSPDGTRLAFVSRRGGIGGSNIHVLELADGALRQLTRGGAYRAPAWSPDGRQIAYVHRGREIWVANPDGSNAKQIYAGPVDLFDPAWSPDGRQIAFRSLSSDPRDSDIYVIDATGGDAWRANSNADALEHLFVYAWHPRANALAIVNALTGGELYRLDALDRDRRILLNRDGSYISPPTWSPDGRQIAFAADFSGSGHIYRLDALGRGLTQLTDQPGTYYRLAWSPDGRALACIEGFAPALPLIIVDPANGDRAAVWTPRDGQIDELAWSPQF